MVKENLQYLSFYFLKDKSGVGWEMKVSKFGKCYLTKIDAEFELLEKKLQQNIFRHFFAGFVERFFHHIDKQANLGIENLPSYDT